MRIRGRVCALAVSSVVVAGLFASTPASADNAEAFAGSAAARALNLQVAGLKVTAGSTGALANSSPKAHADGAGVLLLPGTVSSADADGADKSQATPAACGPLSISIPGILSTAIACSQSSASTMGGAPNASSESTIAAIDVALLQLLAPVLAILQSLAGTIDSVLAPVTTALQPILGTLSLGTLLTPLGLDVGSPVSSLVTKLQSLTTLATIHVGDSTSAVTTEAGKVTATATAQGGEIEVLPGLTLAGEPLLSIVIGSAAATSTFDRTSGTSDATFDPALLTVKLLGTSVSVAVGSVPLPGILELGLGSGRKINNPDGTVGAVADGVSLNILGGTILLELAHAETAVGGAKASITTQSLEQPPAPVLGTELARTGPEAPWLPMGMLLILAAFVTRRVTRARR